MIGDFPSLPVTSLPVTSLPGGEAVGEEKRDRMTGEFYAIAAAFGWALSSVLFKSQTGKIDILSINMLRCLFADIFLIMLLPFVGKLDHFADVSWSAVLYLLGSVILALVVGDTLFFKSMKMIGVSKAMPISGAYPLFTFFLALIFLKERLTWLILLGVVFVVLGVTVIAHSKGNTTEERSGSIAMSGALLAIAAAIFWSLGTTILKVGLMDLDPYVANVIRISGAALIMVFLIPGQIGALRFRRYNLRSLAVVALGGLTGIAVSGLLFISAVKYAGAAKASALGTTSPLFAVLLSWIFLKEKITAEVIIGTMLTVAGIWMIL